MTTARLFKNGRSQAVRLPKEFRFTGTKVIVQRCGEGVLLLPPERGFDVIFEVAGKFTPDFMKRRYQTPLKKRPPLFP